MSNPKSLKLNARERGFANAYLTNGRNATRAYSSVYPNARANTAATGGYTLLRKHHIAAYISEQTEAAFKNEHATVGETLSLIARVARVDPADLLWKTGELDSSGAETTPGSLKSMEQMPMSVRTCIKGWKFDFLGRPEFQFNDRMTALTLLAKHFKLITDKVEFGVDSSFGDMLEEARRKIEGEK